MPLAVPIGGISTRIESLARQAGYDYIASSRYGRWDGKPDKAIPRIVLKEPYDRADAIRDILNGWSMKGIELRLRSLVKQGRNFAAEWKR